MATNGHASHCMLKLTLQGTNGPVTFTIAGSPPSGLLDGVFGTARALAPFGAAPLGASMLIGIRDPAQAQTVAREVERRSFGPGVDAVSVQALLDQTYRANRALILVIDVLMRMGLVVGILGLGIVAMRAVTERRHVIGILRAIGYQRRSVIVGLLSESAISATIGAAVGVVAGISMGYLFYRQSDSRPGFGVDLASIGGVLGLIYLAVLLVTLGPAWRASRLPPSGGRPAHGVGNPLAAAASQVTRRHPHPYGRMCGKRSDDEGHLR